MEAEKSQLITGADADQSHLIAAMKESQERRAMRQRFEGPRIPITLSKTGRGQTIDIPDTLAEAIGRASAFFAAHDVDQVEFFAKGGFGLVARLMKGGKSNGVVMKALHDCTSMRAGQRQLASEAGAMHYSRMLTQLKLGDALPFAPLPSHIGGDTGVVFLPSGPQSGSHGHAVIFMEEAHGSFQADAARLADYFKEPTGKLEADALPHLAQVLRCILLGLHRMDAVGVAHGDVKPSNILKFPAGGAAAGDAVYKDFDNKWMTLRMSDMGNCRLPGVASVPPKLFDAYDPTTRSYQKEPSAGQGLSSKRSNKIHKETQQEAALIHIGAQSGAQTAQSDTLNTVPAFSGPIPMTLLSLHRFVGCAPSSLPQGESAPVLVQKCDAWGGTPGFMPPEANKRVMFRMPLFSHDFIPGDLWSFAIMVLQIMSGDLKNADLHPIDLDQKKLLCEAEDRALWHRYLGKRPMPSTGPCIPDEWKQPLKFVRSILCMQPEQRITAEMALQDPFIQQADKYRPESRHGRKRGAAPPAPPPPPCFL
jgi:serine/threonine protein kinase